VDKINQKRKKTSQDRIKSQSSQQKIPSKKDVLQNSENEPRQHVSNSDNE
jgi:hypothetical protein